MSKEGEPQGEGAEAEAPKPETEEEIEALEEQARALRDKLSPADLDLLRALLTIDAIEKGEFPQAEGEGPSEAISESLRERIHAILAGQDKPRETE